MKKVIKRGLDLILCAALISSISFCFAWSDVSQYADTDVMEMSLSDLASLRTVDSHIKDQLSETQQDYDFLLQYSSSSAMLNEWTVYDLQTAASVIKTNNLTFEQANTLISSWKTATPSAENEIDLEYASILCKDPLSCIEAKESPVTMSYSGDVKTYVNSSDWTGLHYMVRTVTGGYYKASGTFTLPSVNLKSSLSDPDVPYGFFGIYVSDKIGLDLGTYYSQKDGEWGFDISGYIKNSAGEYAHYWRPSSIKYSPSQLSSVNLVATITKGSAYDTVTLKIINGVSWAVIDTITLNTNETGHNATFTKPVNGASESYVTSNYTNLYFNREVCLAYDKQSNRAPTGTTILNARWSQVYLYTPSNGYGLWGTAATTFAHKTAQTSTLANKVSVSITTKWSEDTTNILYQ